MVCTGMLPAAISQLTALQMLELAGFKGLTALPPELFRLTRAHALLLLSWQTTSLHTT